LRFFALVASKQKSFVVEFPKYNTAETFPLLDPRKPLGDGKDSILAGCGGTWMAGTSPAMTSAWYSNPEPPGRGDYEPAKAVR